MQTQTDCYNHFVFLERQVLAFVGGLNGGKADT